MIGRPVSPPSRRAVTSGIWPSSGTSRRLGQLVAAAGAEQLVALAVVAGEPAHVLDDAADLRLTFWAMNPARWATFWAAGCGVVTT